MPNQPTGAEPQKSSTEEPDIRTIGPWGGVWKRYERDPAFRNIVQMMMACIERAQFTPTEIREAAMLAQIIYEDRNPRPTMFARADVISGKV